MKQPSAVTRWTRFFLATFGLWFFVFVAAPTLVRAIPEMQRMADFVDESGIETGEFYYTDVEIVGHADMNAHSTMEYLPKGPGPVAMRD